MGCQEREEGVVQVDMWGNVVFLAIMANQGLWVQLESVVFQVFRVVLA